MQLDVEFHGNVLTIPALKYAERRLTPTCKTCGPSSHLSKLIKTAHWCLSDAPGETCPGPARIFPRLLKNFPWCGKRTNTMARARTLRTQRSPMATPRVCGPASGLSGLLKPLTGLTGLPRGLSQDSPEAFHRTPPEACLTGFPPGFC